MSQKESEWENQTCEVRWTEHGNFRVVCGAPYPCSTHTNKEERKKWITGIVSQREKEIAEEVEKILERHISWKPTEGYESEEECGFQKGLIAEAKLLKKDLLQILKH